jgi:membrane-associated phospholipid phosphatase
MSRRGAALVLSSLHCVLFRCSFPLIFKLSCYQGYSFSIVPLLPRNNAEYITKRVSSTSMDRRMNAAKVVLLGNGPHHHRVSRTMASFSKKDMTIPTAVPSFNSISSFIGKSTSTLVSLLCFATLAYKRNATMVSFFLGSIVNAVVAKVLKRLIKQQRPETTDHDDDDGSTIRPSDNGMPSSHSMSLGFIGTYTYLGWGKNHSIVAPILLIYIITSLFYRVQAKLHTKEQVYVGVMFGGEKNKNSKKNRVT